MNFFKSKKYDKYIVEEYRTETEDILFVYNDRCDWVKIRSFINRGGFTFCGSMFIDEGLEELEYGKEFGKSYHMLQMFYKHRNHGKENFILFMEENGLSGESEK